MVRPGHGLEVVSKVNDIPKGSRLAVSTNLLASLIALLMRATGQARNLTGPLDLEEARVVVARAILGEWLGGSGGGWQDSGGIFPGIKLIQGVRRRRGRPGVGHQPGPAAAGAPVARRSDPGARPPRAGLRQPPLQEALAQSLVLVHGGMAQNVGPILNMVTAKYLLRGHDEWLARQEALGIFDAGAARPSRRPTSARWATGRRGTGTARSRRIIPWVTTRSPRRSSPRRESRWATTSGVS